jgi:hypothetical protein
MSELGYRLTNLLRRLEYSDAERVRLKQLMLLLAELPLPPDAGVNFPRYEEYRQRFLTTAEGHDVDALEEAFLTLYAHLHMHEARYTADERCRLDEAGGYWAHAGGLSPILKAEPWIKRHTVSVDLGAGNGLQGLLLQHLYPHSRTIQIEISSHMVQLGKQLQAWFGIPEEKVEWRVGDVCDEELGAVDFIYLYRPVRPSTARGQRFYRKLADTLAESASEVVIFSIADCLKHFLAPCFEMFYTDGHLTCFRGPTAT